MPLLVLPSPNYKINDAGNEDAAGSPGAGFASVKLTATFNTMTDRTNSGRLLTRAAAYHLWNINIGYNPMTRAEFDPVFSFLMNRRGGLLPFFVELPQYRVPKNSTFATTVATRVFTVSSSGTSIQAGSTGLTFTNSGYNPTTMGTPKPGDIFNLSCPTISNLYKTYMITTVTSSSNTLSLTFSPGLEKTLGASTTAVFLNPKFRVVASKDLQEYSLNTENLYAFSLDLEEALA